MRCSLSWDRDWSAVLRRSVLAWLTGALAVCLLLPANKRSPAVTPAPGLSQLAVMAAVFAAVYTGLRLLGSRRDTARAERWGIPALLLLLIGFSALYYRQIGYLGAALCLAGLCLVYALWGRDGKGQPAAAGADGHPLPWRLLTALGAGLVFVCLAVWGLARVRGYAAPTFDFGIFAQMFHKMSVTGRPLTTLERDGLLSHFAVHFSPIWYVLLPFWLIWPTPELLPILQAAILASSVFPLWLLAKQLGFPPMLRCLACGVLLAHPVLSGGTGYDIHETCFLTPLLLWLFWAAESRRKGMIILFAGLVWAVKEDAPVYTAVLGLYLLARGLLDREGRDRRVGLCLLGGSVVWFLAVTTALRLWGTGTMDYRYGELMDPAHPTLLSVVLTVIVTPLRPLAVAARPAKLLYTLRVFLPLLFLPLLTRKQERYLLLIPFVLYHLLSGDPYQHHLLYHYGFGSLAFLLYLTLMNLRELLPRAERRVLLRAGCLTAALLLGVSVTCRQVLPSAKSAVRRYLNRKEELQAVGRLLDQVPKEAVVTASTFYTQALSDRKTVYDLRSTTAAHLLESDYVVLQPGREADVVNWRSAPDAADGRARLLALLEENGYRLTASCGGAALYRRE